MAVKKVTRYKRVSIDGCTLKELIQYFSDLIEEMGEEAYLDIAHYGECDDLDVGVKYTSLETPFEYENRMSLELSLQKRREESERKQLAELTAKYGNSVTK